LVTPECLKSVLEVGLSQVMIKILAGSPIFRSILYRLAIALGFLLLKLYLRQNLVTPECSKSVLEVGLSQVTIKILAGSPIFRSILYRIAIALGFLLLDSQSWIEPKSKQPGTISHVPPKWKNRVSISASFPPGTLDLCT
jgi:RsiW-degrading membrane proteinase PrsW (M82 family)